MADTQVDKRLPAEVEAAAVVRDLANAVLPAALMPVEGAADKGQTDEQRLAQEGEDLLLLLWKARSLCGWMYNGAV